MKRSKATNSENLKKWGFTQWHRLNFENKENLLKELNELRPKTGVYAIKSDKSFGRFFKNSDIVYIGSSRDKKSGLKGRIKHFFKPGITQKTSKRINWWIRNYPNKFKISLLVTKPQKALSVEYRLLTFYEKKHGELPPFNRNIGIRQN